EMCWDTMAAETEVAIGTAGAERDEPTPDLDSIDAAAAGLRGARPPMVMWGARAQAGPPGGRQAAAPLRAPRPPIRRGPGGVPGGHPLGVAAVAARELWDSADVLLGVGSRLEMPYVRWRDPMRYEREPAGGPTLIRVDIDAAEMQRFRPHIGVVADA